LCPHKQNRQFILRERPSGRIGPDTFELTKPTMPIPFVDVPDIGINGVAARDRSDPSYRRPLVNRRDTHNPLTSA
jgi:hypothetical protein